MSIVNWDIPLLSDLYTDFKDRLMERDENIGKMLFTGDTNVPTGYIQFSRDNSRWEEYDGIQWQELNSEYAIRVAESVTADKLNNQLPSFYLDCANFTGTLAAARVADLDASKITTGQFADARIPNLDAAKITSGTFPITLLDMSAITGHATFQTAVNNLINARFSVVGSTLDIDTDA